MGQSSSTPEKKEKKKQKKLKKKNKHDLHGLKGLTHQNSGMSSHLDSPHMSGDEGAFNPDKKIFGIPLEQAAERSDPEGLVPAPIRLGTAWLNQYGLHEVGLYRIPGALGKVKEYKEKFNRGEDVEFPPTELAENVCSVIIRFLKETPEGLFTFALRDEVKAAESCGDDRAKKLRTIVKKMPPAYRATLKTFIGHLRKVVDNCAQNKMTAQNVAVCIYPTLGRAFIALIEEYDEIFEKPETPRPDSDNMSAEELAEAADLPQSLLSQLESVAANAHVPIRASMPVPRSPNASESSKRPVSIRV